MILATEVHDINVLLNEKNLNPIITSFLGCINRLPLIEIQPVFQRNVSEAVGSRQLTSLSAFPQLIFKWLSAQQRTDIFSFIFLIEYKYLHHNLTGNFILYNNKIFLENVDDLGQFWTMMSVS